MNINSHSYWVNAWKTKEPHPDNILRYKVIGSLLKGNVLDVACGIASLCQYAPGQYVGMDFSETALQRAKEQCPTGIFVLHDITKSLKTLRIPCRIDTLVFGQILEHLDHPEEVLVGFLEHFSAWTRLIVSVPDSNIVPPDTQCEEHVQYFDKDSIRELVEKCTGNSPKLIEGRCSNRFIIAITQKQFHEVRH